MHLAPRLALFALLLAGCLHTSVADEAPLDAIDEPFAIDGKADGQCVSPGTPAAAGLLAFVNDPDVDVQLLDDPSGAGGVGLDRRAAENIVAARPFADLAELDDVPWVGPATCRALAHFACNVARECHAPLSMMSWNVEHFPLTASTENAVVAVMEQLRPDLVGLQEIEDPAAFDRVVARLPDYEGILGQPGSYNGVAILYRPAALELEAVEDLFVDDWYAFPRPVLVAKVRPRKSLDAAATLFAVVHLKAMSDGSSQTRRRTAIEKLRAWIEGRRAAGDRSIAVVGDFNDKLDDPAPDNVFGALLDASADVAFLTDGPARAGEITLVPYQSMIDHVAVTHELLESLDHETTRVLALDETWPTADFVATVSDHRPVRSDFIYAAVYP